MARPRQKDILFSAAVADDTTTGPFIRYLRAQGYSENTIADYSNGYRHWLRLNGDALLRDITADDVEHVMATLRSETVAPAGIAPRPARKRKPKTLSNYYVAYASLWNWAVARHYADRHIVRDVSAPTVPDEPVEPLTVDEIAALVRATRETRAWRTNPRTTTRRCTAERDQALILLLYDTAARISEICHLRVDDVVLERHGGKIHIREGKNRKSRWVPFGRRTALAVMDYLEILEMDLLDPEHWLFVNIARNYGARLRRDPAGRLVKRLGKKAGIQRAVTPHLLRTTAACHLARRLTAWQLRELMGHSNIETTLRYVRAANLDLEEAMRKASPVDNLRL